MNLEKLIGYIKKCVEKQIDMSVALRNVGDIVKGIPDLNMRERARLTRAYKKLTVQMYMQQGELYNKQIYRVSADTNKTLEHRNSRKRLNELGGDVKRSRSVGNVFYICSVHSNPAEKHKDLQGKIYVDRFWRAVLRDDDEMTRAVASYIRNHNIMTVQEVCSEPYYLITRPYCKHKLIPLDTEEVLRNGVKGIIRKHPEVKVSRTNVDYRIKFLKLRKRIHTVLDQKGEARRDEILLNRARQISA